MEALTGAHLIDGALHGGAAGLGQGLGHIANAEANDRGCGVGLTEGLDPPSDLREEVARFELEVVAVDLGHRCGMGRRRARVIDGTIVLCGLLAHIQGRLHPDARADLEARFHRGDQ